MPKIKIFIQALFDTETGCLELCGDSAIEGASSGSHAKPPSPPNIYNIYNKNLDSKKEKKENLINKTGGVGDSRDPAGSGPCEIHEAFASDPVLIRLLASVRTRSQQSWIDAYPDIEWIGFEVKKARAWIEANPRKSPKSFARFVTGWLSRSWEFHRRTIPSNRPGQGAPIKVTDAEIFGNEDGAL